MVCVATLHPERLHFGHSHQKVCVVMVIENALDDSHMQICRGPMARTFHPRGGRASSPFVGVMMWLSALNPTVPYWPNVGCCGCVSQIAKSHVPWETKRVTTFFPVCLSQLLPPSPQQDNYTHSAEIYRRPALRDRKFERISQSRSANMMSEWEWEREWEREWFG